MRVGSNHGFTLLELLIAVSLLAVLAGLATPSLRTFLLDTKRTARINAFVTSIQLARSESAKRARPVALCKSVDTVVCGGDEIRYDAGWMVFVNEDGILPPERNPGEPLLWYEPPRPEATIQSNRKLYYFRPFLRRSTNGTVTFCDVRGEEAARAVIVSYTGRPRVSATKPNGAALSCDADGPN